MKYVKKKMNDKTYKLSLVALIVSLITSCGSGSEFNSTKWQEKGVDWWMTDVRERMVDDLVSSDTLMNMDREQVLKLLGQPTSENDAELTYLVREKYSRDIDPDYITYLKIVFDGNGLVRHCEIEK